MKGSGTCMASSLNFKACSLERKPNPRLRGFTQTFAVHSTEKETVEPHPEP